MNKTTLTVFRKLLSGLMATGMLMCAGTLSQAQNAVWTGGGANAQWNTVLNWSGSTTPTSSLGVLFDTSATANLTGETLGANQNANGIRIGSPAGNVSINAGNTLTNYGGIDMSAATVGFNLAANQVYSNNPTWTIASGHFTNAAASINIGSNTLTVNVTSQDPTAAYITQSSIVGGGSFVKLGAGTLNCGGGSYTGETSVYQGTNFLVNNNLGASWTPLAISGGATVVFNGKQVFSGSLYLTNGDCGTGNNGNFDVSNVVSSGSSTISVSELRAGADGSNAKYTSVFDVEDGILALNIRKLYNTQSSSTGSVVKVGSGSAILWNNLNLSTANWFKGALVISNGLWGTYNITNSGLDSGIGQSGNDPTNLVLNGGTLQYLGGRTFTDHRFSLGVNGAGTIDASGTGALQFTNPGAALMLGSGAHAFVLTGTNFSTNLMAVAIGDNGGATAFSKTSTGFWLVTGTNTYSGATYIGGGTLMLAQTGYALNTASVEVTNATLVISNGASFNLANRINDSATVTLEGGSLNYVNDGTSGPFTETMGALMIGAGPTTNNIYVGLHSTLIFASVTTNANSYAQPTINFQIADPATSKILFSTPPATGGLPSWITLNGSSCAYDPANGVVIPGAYVGSYTTNLFTGGDAGGGLDLQGASFNYAEYYGGYEPVIYAGAADDLLPVQNVTFNYPAGGTTVAGNDVSSMVNINGGIDPFASQPNLGSDENDTNAAWICNTFIQANGTDLSFNVPTVNGQPYKLQLLFHEANITTVGTKVVSVNIGAQTVVPAMDLAALRASGTQPAGFVVSYLFTGNGSPLPVLLHGFSGVNAHAILNGLTLEALPSGLETPHFFLSPASQNGIEGSSATFTALAMGGTNLVAYQWYFGGVPISGQTNTSLTISGLMTTNAGTYAVVARNSAGSATNTASLTVDTSRVVSVVAVTGPYPGQGLNLNGNIVLAEYYGNAAGANLAIGNALFVPSTRPGGTSNGGNLPNFGSNPMDYSLANLSYYSVYAGTLDFTIPTTSGVQYRLQLIMHDNHYPSAGQRIFTVKAGGYVLAQNLDLAALGANQANPEDIAVVYSFTGDGNPLDINLAASLDNAILCGLTLEDLSSPPSVPTVLLPVGNVFGVVGGQAQFFTAASGGGLSYQWQKMVGGSYVNLADGSLPDGTQVTGSTSNILTLSNLTVADATNYNVVVANTAGSVDSAGQLQVMTPSPNALIGEWLSGSPTYADMSGYALPGTHDGFLAGAAGNVSWDTDVPATLSSFGGYSLNINTSGGVELAISNTAVSDPNYAPTYDAVITNSFTVAAWVKGWPSGSYGTFVSKNGEQSIIGTNGFQLRKYGSTAQATFTTRSGANAAELTSTNATIINSNVWHHYVGTRNGATGQRCLYIDSVLVTSLTNDFGPMGPAMLDHLVIGARQQDGGGYGNQAAGVKIYDVRMYGYALSVGQISAIDGITNGPLLLAPVASQAAVAGDTVQFSVNAFGLQLAYQWQKIVGGVTNNLTDTGNVTGSAASILTLANVSTNDAGTYQVVVTNPGGSTSAVAYLTVITTAPSLIGEWLTGSQSLADQSGFSPVGRHDGFFVGDGTQVWASDAPHNFAGYSVDLSGGNCAVSITNSATSDAGYATTFDRLITNSFTVAAWVKGWPVGGYDPFVSKKGEGSAGGTNGFQLRQWYTTQYPVFTVRGSTLNGITDLGNANAPITNTTVWHHIVGTRNSTTGVRKIYVDSALMASETNDFGPMGMSTIDHLVLGGKQQDGGGYQNWAQVKLYDVRMYNYDLTEAQIAGVNGLTNPPSFLAQPVSQGVIAGATVQLSANADGIQLAYQWEKILNGVTNKLTDVGNVTGSTSNVLTLTSVGAGDMANYQIVVTNPVGSISAVVHLSVENPGSSDLIGHWLSGAQNLTDSSGFQPAGTHDGFLVGTNPAGAAWSADVPTNLPSFSGAYSLDLSAGNVAVAISNTASVDPAYAPTFDALIANSFTVAVWVKGWPTNSFGVFVGKKGESTSVGTNGFQLRESVATVRAELVVCRTNMSAVTMAANLVATNVWHHFVGTRNGATGLRNLYVDSVLVATLTNDFGPMIPATLDHLALGARSEDGGSYANFGQVKLFDARMYDYALTQAQIETLNGIVAVPPTPSPISFSIANGQLIMNWTNGVLESTTNLSEGNWIFEAVGNPPVTVIMSGTGNKFYRVISQ